MTRTAGAPIGCQRPSRFWGLGCPKIYHEAEDTLDCGRNDWETGFCLQIRQKCRIRIWTERIFRLSRRNHPGSPHPSRCRRPPGGLPSRR
ncbi:hypothetical protein [Thiolapillus sp.]|uniref:hypothetical protein n=1 Tax=Thiolapillus sp. TaxID=2017437 RepID=UPI00263A8ECB|nr:hypothetical protein [Thiolapillus sp.]